MSYCRFQNTRTDFHDCKGALEDMIHGEEESLSRDERSAAKDLILSAFDMIQLVRDELHLDEESEITEDVVEEFLSSLEERAKQED